MIVIHDKILAYLFGGWAYLRASYFDKIIKSEYNFEE